jgi:hypothetical protein
VDDAEIFRTADRTQLECEFVEYPSDFQLVGGFEAPAASVAARVLSRLCDVSAFSPETASSWSWSGWVCRPTV